MNFFDVKKFNFKKNKGQNFLKNKDIINKIIESGNFNKEKSGIIEIGSGAGAITDSLVLNCKKLIGIEIDPELVLILQKKYENYKHIEIIEQDFLKIDLEKLIKEKFVDFDKKDITIISNLPYYITSPIIFKLLSCTNYINSFILMMQKEVADRIQASINTKKYNNLSIVTSYYCDISKVIDVNKDNFIPIPKVDSSVLKFDINKKFKINDEEKFLYFIRKIFNNKRKTINNNLKNYLDCNGEKSKNILNDAKINYKLRPENITLDKYYEL